MVQLNSNHRPSPLYGKCYQDPTCFLCNGFAKFSMFGTLNVHTISEGTLMILSYICLLFKHGQRVVVQRDTLHWTGSWDSFDSHSHLLLPNREDVAAK